MRCFAFASDITAPALPEYTGGGTYGNRVWRFGCDLECSSSDDDDDDDDEEEDAVNEGERLRCLLLRCIWFLALTNWLTDGGTGVRRRRSTKESVCLYLLGFLCRNARANRHERMVRRASNK